LAFLAPGDPYTGVMSLAVALPLAVVVLTAAVSVATVRRLEQEARALRSALEGLADLPGLLAALRAETLATGVTARTRPNP